MNDFIIWSRIGYFGQEIYAFSLSCGDKADYDEVRLEIDGADSASARTFQLQTKQSEGIRRISFDGQEMRIEIEPIAFKNTFHLIVKGKAYSLSDATRVLIQTVDDFTAEKDGELLYRLYIPEEKGPRPLILFLHGGGEKGRDNKLQLTANFGPAKLAETYPDAYVMAPQAVGRDLTAEDIEAFKRMTFATSDQPDNEGWNRRYLGLVCDKIREMVMENLVNPERIYVTGISMGGAGTLRALSVGSDLFAAALPVCPSMTPETFAILKGLTTAKLWIMASYIDHTLYRHKYLVDGVLHLRDAGNRNAKLTLFSPEELAAYGIGIDSGMPLEVRFAQNHACWIPAYNNAHGALAWMMEQIK